MSTTGADISSVGGQSSKRPLEPSKVLSVSDVAAWLEDVMDDGGCGNVSAETKNTVLERVRENEIDREVLATLSESDLTDTLGIKVLGQRRKMMQRIKDLLGLVSAPPAQVLLGAQTPEHLHLHPVASPTLWAPSGQAQAHLSFTPHRAAMFTSPASASVLQLAPTAPGEAAAAAPDSLIPFRLPGQAPSCPENSAVAVHVLPAIEIGQNSVGDANKEEREAAEAEAVRLREEAEADAARLRSVPMELTCELKEKMQAEDFCINEGQWAAKKLIEVLRRSFDWAIPAQRMAMVGELETLQDRIKMPGCSVVTVGDTGAGKSTLLNALLGETCVLPTNGMRACTASIIELSFNMREDGDPYVGSVEFVSREEWDAEFVQLLDDLTQQDGKAILREPDQRAPSHASWCKLYAIYGTAYTNSLVETGMRRPDGRKEQTAPTIESLKRKLIGHTRVTRVCGTTQQVTAKTAAEFRRKLERFMDSDNDASEGQFWPLVKRVKMTSRNWTLLKTGGKLVDAPGVRDDNNARDKVVKQYLREADSIWIVASINRAVNDKTAKNMLGESFRRELLMDGQYGQICFVATQSDVLNRSDIARSLSLAQASSSSDCASQRNRFTKERIIQDFYAGLAEMASHAHGTVSAEELRERYRLPVFCVSAVDFQKLSGCRLHDGAPNVWSTVEETEIPSLQRYFHETVLQKRFARASASMTALVNFCDTLESFLAPEAEAGPVDKAAVRAQAFATYSKQEKILLAAIDEHTAALAAKVDGHFTGMIGPQLEVGAQQASAVAMNTAHKWRSMHWSTYKATLRRMGQFRIDMNQELAEHIFRAVSTVWDKIFSVTAQKDLQETQVNLRLAFKTMRTEFKAQLSRTHQPDMSSTLARAEVLEGPQERSVEAKLDEAIGGAKVCMTDKQRELSRSVVPLIQTTMIPAYNSGMAERGTGSGARRQAIVESHLDRHKGHMFQESVKNTQKELPVMKSSVVHQLKAAALAAVESQRVTFSSLWEAEASSPAMQLAQKQLLLQLKTQGFMSTARLALKKLRVAHKLESKGIANDDELTDITDERQPEDLLDLTSDTAHGEEKESCVVSMRTGQGNAFRVMISVHDALGRVFAAFCERNGASTQEVKFMFDGERIDDSATPQSLDMETTVDNLVDAVLP